MQALTISAVMANIRHMFVALAAIAFMATVGSLLWTARQGFRTSSGVEMMPGHRQREASSFEKSALFGDDGRRLVIDAALHVDTNHDDVASLCSIDRGRSLRACRSSRALRL